MQAKRLSKIMNYLLNFIKAIDIIYIGSISIWRKKDEKGIHYIAIKHLINGTQVRSYRCSNPMKAYNQVK